jgi:hypothetical protein
MAWIYFQEAEVSRRPSADESEPSPTVRTTDTLKPCSCLECIEENSTAHRFGTTCKLCEGTCFPSLWISSPADSRARISALRDMARAWTEADRVFSLRSFDSLASSDHATCSWRTSQLSLFGGLTEFSWNSMRWGLMRDGQLYQPERWAPRTSENASGFWPTPTAEQYGTNQSPSPGASVRPGLASLARKWPTPLASEGSNGGPNSCDHGTPKLSNVAVNWASRARKASPTARDWKGQDTPSTHGQHSPSLDIQVSKNGHQGYLNPRFVEVMMGWPIGATHFASWATGLFLRPRKKPLTTCSEAKP